MQPLSSNRRQNDPGFLSGPLVGIVNAAHDGLHTRQIQCLSPNRANLSGEDGRVHRVTVMALSWPDHVMDSYSGHGERGMSSRKHGPSGRVRLNSTTLSA